MGDLGSIADRLAAGKSNADTLRFSEAIVPSKKGVHQWGAVISTSPALMRLFCDIWNNRVAIAAALRERT